jgi:hypothetical protein
LCDPIAPFLHPLFYEIPPLHGALEPLFRND